MGARFCHGSPMRAWIKAGLAAGVLFSVVGVTFVAVSLFTEIPRPAWVVLDNVKGVVGFGCCALAGALVARQTGRASFGAAAGALGGTMAGLVVPVSMYVLAYGMLDAVRQYPFEYYDYLSSGAPDIRAFLTSSSGRATVFSTSIGLAPLVASFAAALGGLVGYAGGWAGMRLGRDAHS